MRYKLAQEVDPQSVNAMLADGCIKWDENPVHVYLSSGGESIGLATDIRREEDHSITAKIEWEVDSIPPDFELSISLHECKYHQWAGMMFVETGILYEICMTFNTGLPRGSL